MQHLRLLIISDILIWQYIFADKLQQKNNNAAILAIINPNQNYHYQENYLSETWSTNFLGRPTVCTLYRYRTFVPNQDAPPVTQW